MSTRPPANGFVRAARRLYNPLGFSKGYNFSLWFVLAGAMMGFVLASFRFYRWTNKCDGPGGSFGDCYYYQKYLHEKVGILMHLAGILPASFIACLQFTPVIRHKFLLLHRIGGYAAIILSVPGTVGAFLTARHAFGGGLDIQALVGVFGILFLGSLVLAYVNIKRLQIEQHRAWMLRAWGGAIITARLIMFAAVPIITSLGGYHATRSCDSINYMFGSESQTLDFFPECEAYYSGSDVNKQVIVKAAAGYAGPVGMHAVMGVTFGMACWMAFAIHAVGVEIYLHLTPAEAERLRNVSYQRQVEAGMKKPGRAGLTADRLGDSNMWTPSEAEKMESGDGVSGGVNE